MDYKGSDCLLRCTLQAEKVIDQGGLEDLKTRSDRARETTKRAP
jgi:hypothetical protein